MHMITRTVVTSLHLVFVTLMVTPALSAPIRSDDAARDRGCRPTVGELAVEFRPTPGVAINSAQQTADGVVAASTRQVDDRRELVLQVSSGGQVRPLAAPGDRRGKLRDEPLPIITRGDLAALAWLEGDTRESMAVRVSRRQGERWLDPETVSPSGPGSQLALTGAVLDDGSWLLAWSAFDGQDDEIRWSRYQDGNWSPPASITDDNAVPDITPALVVQPGGALLAWSRYDGNDYRVRTARFNGQGWRAAEEFGPRSSVFPSFVICDDRAFLLFQTAVPRTWSVGELDETGRVARLASVPSNRNERPRLTLHDEGAGFTLLWQSDGSRESAAWRGRR